MFAVPSKTLLAVGPGLSEGSIMPTNSAFIAVTERGIRTSLNLSRDRIRAALSLPCPQCAASPGAYCFSTHGFCTARWMKAVAVA